MRIIDYFNLAAAFLTCAMTLLCVVLFVKRGFFSCSESVSGAESGAKSAGSDSAADLPARSRAAQALFLTASAAAGLFLRLYKLGIVPFGIQQDEANMGYEALILARYGVDRDLNPWPVYPITWGSGGGSPLMIYLNVLSAKLLGSGIFVLRLLPAILGVLTIPLFYLIIKKTDSRLTALAGAACLAVCPWHIMLSRWSLDSNIMPFTLLAAVYLFILAQQKRSSKLYILSAALFALCLYSYGSATIVVPVHLVLVCLYSIKTKRLTVRQFLSGIAAFIAVCIPLAAFYAVNYLHLPPVVTSLFSVTRFTTDRTGSVFNVTGKGISGAASAMLHNLKDLIMLIGPTRSGEQFCNYIPGYSWFYLFMIPFTVLGIISLCAELIKKKDVFDARFSFLSLLISCSLFALLIEQDMNRMVMIYPALLYCCVTGMKRVVTGLSGFLLQKASRTAASVPALVLMLLLAAGTASFAKDYFGETYRVLSQQAFMPGYDLACAFAEDIAASEGGGDRQIYSTYDGLSAPYMIAAYSAEIPVSEYAATVHYRDLNENFRIADKVGNFVFSLPEDYDDPSHENVYGKYILILSHPQADAVSDLYRSRQDFGNYSVVWD